MSVSEHQKPSYGFSKFFETWFGTNLLQRRGSHDDRTHTWLETAPNPIPSKSSPVALSSPALALSSETELVNKPDMLCTSTIHQSTSTLSSSPFSSVDNRLLVSPSPTISSIDPSESPHHCSSFSFNSVSSNTSLDSLGCYQFDTYESEMESRRPPISVPPNLERCVVRVLQYKSNGRFNSLILRDVYGFKRVTSWISFQDLIRFDDYYYPILLEQEQKWQQLLRDHDQRWPLADKSLHEYVRKGVPYQLRGKRGRSKNCSECWLIRVVTKDRSRHGRT
ncbi:uncharacterized protein BYT42DRAFT_106921 [Radiomyces spectabilis]|uniref:uncharacterized protein n=1 Tax=Radiomyces spectabilis TaxID=64574 RepID=UPI00222075FF|nr:uncharacterized protein BYT42DRAFT_106921 [Radiomyces spectabilis]KAI8369368.1 hypothetical protein BYT42DRAFT_106921 [Radiomyces spectabilis]